MKFYASLTGRKVSVLIEEILMEWINKNKDYIIEKINEKMEFLRNTKETQEA